MRAGRFTAGTAALLAAVLLTAGCGSSSPVTTPAAGGPAIGTDLGTDLGAGDTDRSPLPPACDLVDPTALAPVLATEHPEDGAFTVTTKDNSQGEVSSCDVSWGAANWTPKTFQVQVLYTDNLQYTDPIGAKRVIPGVGDEAFEAGDNWFARKGSVVVHVVNVQETDEVSDRILADTVSRLPG